MKGEFEKEMQKIWNKYAELPFNSMAYGEELMRTLRKMIDEARKEFPDLDKYVKTFGGYSRIMFEAYAKDCVSFKEKWFGEADDK